MSKPEITPIGNHMTTVDVVLKERVDAVPEKTLQEQSLQEVDLNDHENASKNWKAIILFSLTTVGVALILPIYLYFYDLTWQAWLGFFVFLAWSGLGITAGYHRLWSHRTYQASLLVRIMLMIGGTLAVQNSILYWSSGHRKHHRFVDDVDMDPYSAKRGLWFSHMGWMLKNYQSAELGDYRNSPDLLKDKLVMFQHNHYNALVLITNIGLIGFCGWLIGDFGGVMLMGGLVRLVANHHSTFFINSLAHKWGKQPYTTKNTAKDNFWLALFTWGEGYHNFHHIFQHDFRNGIKWWQFDPTKWLILSLSKVGLTYDLKRIPMFTIYTAEVQMKFKTAQEILASRGDLMREEIQQIRDRISAEYESFSKTLAEWTTEKEKSFEASKLRMSEKFQAVDLHVKSEYLKLERKIQQSVDKLLEARMNEHRKHIANLTYHLK